MSKYILDIELLSDLCVSDGGVYNSMLDIDICRDRYGFPYIPARRIKGCLRECALELNDWGDHILSDKIFGSAGERENAGNIRISNARLCGWRNYTDEVKKCEGAMLYHPQNVLNHYSYIRTQTRINYETGAAEDNSLRTMRVVKKGLRFEAEIEIDGRYYEQLKRCVDVFTSMGISRTRGLGEICCELKPFGEKPDGHGMDTKSCDIAGGVRSGQGNSDGGTSDKDIGGAYGNAPLKENAVFLSYRLDLEEPMICKSVNGGESKTLDYIEGGKILGIILERLRKQGENIQSFLDGAPSECGNQAGNNSCIKDGAAATDKSSHQNSIPLTVSNAYLTVEVEKPGKTEKTERMKKRLTEVPAYLYGIKNDDSKYINKLCRQDEEEQRQLQSMKHCYVYMDENGSLHKSDVSLEERYHHRRPEDKSIGRAVETAGGDSAFYQISSITEGQSFSGHIVGSREQIRKIYDAIVSDPVCRAGYGSSAEYGKSRIYVTETRAFLNIEEYKTKRIVATLISPAIVYNEKAMYSVSSADLLEEILAACGLKSDGAISGSKEDMEYVKQNADYYVKYTMLGGFNVTWKRRKPVISAFDQGTSIDIRFREPVSIHVENPLFIGERNLEGYGECRIAIVEDAPGRRECEIVSEDGKNGGSKEERESDGAKKVDLSTADLGKKIADKLLRDCIAQKAAEEAGRKERADLRQEEVRPVIGNMLLMCRDSAEIADVQKAVSKRYEKATVGKEKKQKYAQQILDLCSIEKIQQIFDDFSAGYRLEHFEPEMEKYRKIYLEGLLNELKYQIRHQKGAEGSEE